MARMTPFWPAHLSSLGRAFVHHSNHAQIKTFSSNSLASSSITTTIHMSAQSPLTNSHVASGWLTIFNIGCHMKGTNLDSTHQCLVVHLPGFFDLVHSHLLSLRDANCEVFSPNQFAALAATIQTLVNGLLLAWDVFLRQTYVSGLYRLCTSQPNLR